MRRRIASTPTPAGPPHLWALPVSIDHPVGTAILPRTGPRPRAAAPRPRRRPPTPLPSGCTVPTSWFADCTASSPTSPAPSASARASRSSDPSASTPTVSWRPPALTCSAPACSTAECSTAEVTSLSPARRRPPSPPSTPRCSAWVPLAVKTTSSGRAGRWAATTSRALSSSSRARRPSRYSRAGSAHPSSRAASITSRAAGCSFSPDAASRYVTSDTFQRANTGRGWVSAGVGRYSPGEPRHLRRRQSEA